MATRVAGGAAGLVEGGLALSLPFALGLTVDAADPTGPAVGLSAPSGALASALGPTFAAASTPASRAASSV